MKYPNDQEFLKLIKKNWKEKYQLPSNIHIKEMLEVAYHSSFKKEEQRDIAFHLVYISKNDYESLKSTPHYTEFYTFRKFCISEVVKLAPAINHEKSAISLREKEGKLFISGIINLSSREEKDRYLSNESKFSIGPVDFNSGYIPLDAFGVFSDEPGKIRIFTDTFTELSIEDGIIKEKDLLNQTIQHLKTQSDKPSDILMDGVANTLNETFEVYKVTKEKGMAAFGNLSDTYRRLFKASYAQIWMTIIQKISMSRHGGTIIVLPVEIEDISEIVINLSIKYRCLNEELWNNLKGSYASREYYRASRYNLENSSHSIPQELVLEHNKSWIDLLATQKRVSDTIEYIANLSQVDGAVVLSDTFAIYGFGTEIVVPSNEIEIDEHLQRKGTRYRSTYRLCKLHKNIYAFVISQDGGVTLLKTENDKLQTIELI